MRGEQLHIFCRFYVVVRREVLYKILIEFGIPRKLARLIKMSLTETYSTVRVGKNVSHRLQTLSKLMIQLGGRSYIRFSLSLVSVGNL